MKKIRVILLTLVLSISMLAPEFSMLPAVYAQDQTPAAAVADADADSQKAPKRASSVAANAEAADANSQNAPESATTPATASDITDNGVVLDLSAAGTEDAASADSVQAENADGVGTPAADPANLSETPVDADPETPQLALGSYDKFYMTELNEAGAIKIPEEMQDKITIEPTEYGMGLLFTGKVADLNSTYINLDYEFDFDKGSIGRLTFDGLKDKDLGMSVQVELYLDDCKSPTSTFELKKQMGKKEWANDGERSFSMGESEITGKHKVALLLKITGKKDTAKTSVMLRSLQFCETTLPVMYFNIDESEGTIEAMNNSSDHSVECYGSVDLVVPDTFNSDETFRDEYGEQSSQYGMALEYIRGRGNSTWSEDKRPYKVKFDKGQNLFGFGKNKHWVLLANRFDNSLVRNRMTYWLGQQLGMEYTPQCVPVEVVMNGEFYGSYLLCEQIRVGTGRVTIDDLDDEDPLAITDPLIETGGYLLSMDYEEDEKRSFETDHGMTLFIESPDDNVTYFSDYIKAYTQKVENAIFGSNFKDEAGHPYTDYLDMDAAVDYWWVQEFSANGDAYGSGSTYLYKKRDAEGGDAGKLYWGPLWDFDYVAWGDLEYGGEAPEGLNYTGTPWFERMKTDPEFIEKVKTRWYEEGGLKDQLSEITKEGGRLDQYIAQMATSYNYDHEKYGAFESELTDYKDEIEQLRAWILDREQKVEDALSEMKIEDHVVKFSVDGKVVKEVTVKGFLTEGDFPEVPEKKGYVFMYWYDEEEYGEYAVGSLVTRDITLTAEFIKESDIVKPQKIFFDSYDVYTTIYSDSYYGYSTGWYWPEVRVMPEDAWDTDITWTSSDESIAECDDEFGGIKLKGKGEATITATTSNGVSRSFVLHIVDENELVYSDGMEIDKTKMKLKEGEFDQVVATATEQPSWEQEVLFVSTDESVATVDEIGVVTAVGGGTADILVVNMENREVMKCRVTVTGANQGRIVKRKGNTYKITSDKKGKRTAMLIKARNAKTVVIPASIKVGKRKYSVNKIKAKAFAKSKATRVKIKTKKLAKARVRNAFKDSKVYKVYVRVGKKNVNKKYIKKYTKIFTKKNAGKYIIVSAMS